MQFKDWQRCFSALLLMASAVPATLTGAYVAAQDESVAEAQLAEAVAETELSIAEAAESARPMVRPLTVAASLVDESVITGTLMDSTALSIRTAFGPAEIPLSEVAGIRFPAADDTATTVVMLNGDSITGATDLKFISVETTWGSAKVNGQSIASLLFVPGLAWRSSESLGGKRWALVEAAAASQQDTPRSQIGSLGQPVNRSGSGSGATLPSPGTSPIQPLPRITYGTYGQ